MASIRVTLHPRREPWLRCRYVPKTDFAGVYQGCIQGASLGYVAGGLDAAVRRALIEPVASKARALATLQVPVCGRGAEAEPVASKARALATF